jgi:hypothetical protein
LKISIKPIQFAILACILLYIWQVLSVANKYQRFEKVINEDAVGYYLILPALFIYNDPNFEFIDSSIRQQENFNGYFPPVVNLLENNKNVCKYYSGVALLQSPFFIIGNIILQQFKTYNGFELPYHFILLLSVIFYISWSIILLFKSLKLLNIPWYWSMSLVFVVIFGTNLQLYTTYDLAYSHSYSFFCFIALIYCSLIYRQTPQLKTILFIGLLIGLIVVIRPANILITLVPLFIIPFSVIKNQLKRHLIPLILSLSIAPLIQISLWHWQTGDWIVYPYKTETLNIFNSQIAELLWSYNCGWFTYTPIMPLIVIFSCFSLLFQRKFKALLSFIFILFPSIYIIASWYYIHYGCTLGCRPITEFYGPIILIFAYSIRPFLIKKWFYLSFISIGISSLIYNQVLHYQFSNFILNSCEMNKDKFKMIFLKTHPFYAYSTFDFWKFDQYNPQLILDTSANMVFKIDANKLEDKQSFMINEIKHNDSSVLIDLNLKIKISQNINESFLTMLITEKDKYVDLQNLLLKRVVKQSDTWTKFKYQILVNKPTSDCKIDFTLGSINNKANTELIIESIAINKIKL